MVRPEDRYSARSCRLKHTKSDTCSPLGSMTFRRWPLCRTKAVPLRGFMSCGLLLDMGIQKRALPGIVVGLAGVLVDFGSLPKVLQHGVYGARVGHVAAADGVAQLVVAPLGSDLLELGVGVEYQRGVLKLPGQAAAAGVQAHHEKSLLFNAKAELRRAGVGHHAWVVAVAPGVEVGDALQALPEQLLKHGLRWVFGAAEDDGRAVVKLVRLPVAVHKLVEEFEDGRVVFEAGHVVNYQALNLLPGQGRLGRHAGKFFSVDKLKILPGFFICCFWDRHDINRVSRPLL